MRAAFNLATPKKTKTRTISITSGKGGVGKSSMVANLSYELGQRGQRVLILDGDMGMANVDIMFGARSYRTIENALSGDCRLDDVIISVEENVYLIPGGSGVYGLNQMDPLQKQLLLDQVNGLDMEFDYMLIDTAPGIDDHVLYLNSAAQEIMILVTPDPASLADAYALIKVLNIRHHENKFSIVVNLAKDESEALSVFRRLSDVAAQFLCVSLDYKGFVPLDPILRQATKSQQLVRKSQPFSPSSLAIRKLAEKLGVFNQVQEAKGGIQFFWQQLSGVA